MTPPKTTSGEAVDSRSTALIDAAWDNDVARARELIREGADVNFEDETEQSAYLIAASEGYLDLLELALENGANVNALDSYDGTALIRAAERGHADVVGRLLRAGIDIDHVNRLGWTALHEAIKPDEALLTAAAAGDADGVAIALRAGADIEARDRHQRTSLLLATADNNIDVLHLLVAHGADAGSLDDRDDMQRSSTR